MNCKNCDRPLEYYIVVHIDGGKTPEYWCLECVRSDAIQFKERKADIELRRP